MSEFGSILAIWLVVVSCRGIEKTDFARLLDSVTEPSRIRNRKRARKRRGWARGYCLANQMGPHHLRPAAFLTALTTLLLMVVACSADGPATVNVAIKNFKYDPDPITISVGDSIVWTNEDPVGHTSTATDDSFNTGMFFPDDSATLTFDTAGTFPYFCATHPEMIGTVVVEPAE